MVAEIDVGDRVIRKAEPSGRLPSRPGVGVVERIFTTWGKPVRKATVRWEGALRPFRGGRSDNHSSVALAALLPATDENIAAAQVRLNKRIVRHFDAQVRHYNKLARDYEAHGWDERAEWARGQAERHAEKVTAMLDDAGEVA